MIGAQATRRLSGRPRKAKPCTEINCGVISSPAHVSYLFVIRSISLCLNLFFIFY
ncbi:hypothetical protein [Priestia aryabhattai]|uniref:hypothetical protein n=1 Tax=Priestia aryabhattai TaxID=412384 RepID=UPI001483B297|nr:hypothetical protein [Priestia aryabhattai]